MMTRRQVFFYISIIFTILLGSSCAAPPSEQATVSTPTLPAITPYNTSTPTTSSYNAEDNIQATSLPQPSATPFLYQIQKDDTLSVIAYRHSLTLDDLLAANPGIDPNFLSIGTKIIIPMGDGNHAIPPTPTPFSAEVNQPRCYPTSDGGLWCIALVNNGESHALENITASITLLSASGDLLAQGTALPPINKVGAESSIVVAAFFPEPVPPYQSVHIQLLTALPIIDETRYLETKTQLEENILDSNSAIVRGTVEISTGESSVQHLIVAAIAYDQDGNPIGIRKWSTTMEITDQTRFPFEISVFSLGPPIFEVEIISEARP
ncbi:MAG: LysM domain-containing protein [Chloroflexota bacterium]